ncbi:transcriptional regulator with XRE-family HTH domain [Murinocardiopsis flavida]|uniref:Transcriptional regulator with XRE-family HTH domain n=1 Tax=Murinocardiopsis flavida TaxID=645275 RepID=A0A2P8DIN4_9ACTN|nr:helix-turn-helix transcriptional regulator [Murinocardiopsis flavida]PSK97051.1 transcriptional regulator with XRE-family HTH domain [Murinocardiopsis flavida]
MSSDTWTQFGAEVSALRERSGLSQQQLSNATDWSRGMISAIERGTRKPKLAQVEALDGALNAGGSLIRLWSSRVGRAEVPAWFRKIAVLEQQATEISEYQPMVVPGLLQTESYAHAVVSGGALSEARDVAAVVRSRLERHGRLRSDVLLRFVISESVLRSVKGVADVMVEQMTALLDASARVSVLPATDNHPVYSPFRVMGFGDRPKVGYVEHALGGEVIDDPGKVRTLEIMMAALLADSMPGSASTALIEEVRTQYEQG